VNGDRWGPEGPPEAAYGRVTRDLPTLYAPVVDAARTMIDQLARVEGCVSDALETVALVPRSDDQSPLIVGVCDLPGVHLAYGRWASEHLPACGCDACDETPDELLDLLIGTRDLVIGGFTEWVRRGEGQWWVGHQTAVGSREGSLDRGERRRLDIREPIELAWQPWRRP
jgi:Family of unknown function (DUF6226)